MFVALGFPQSVRTDIWNAASPLRDTDISVRWTPREQLHITLRFLGEVAAAAVAEVDGRLAEAARDREPFTLSMGGVGAFPSMKRPRVIWLATRPSAPMRELHRSVEVALDKCGFEPEGRPFRPHITLGRVRQPRRGAAPPLDPRGLARAAQAIGFRANVDLTHLYLMSSRLGAGGAKHSVEGAYALAGKPVLPTGS
jgi:2'-5' RNA ligase